MVEYGDFTFYLYNILYLLIDFTFHNFIYIYIYIYIYI